MAGMAKGEEGKNTGSAVRSAIRAAVKKGLSMEDIGKATNRTGGTISAILAGEIKNPPSGLSAQISAIPAPKKKDK